MRNGQARPFIRGREPGDNAVAAMGGEDVRSGKPTATVKSAVPSPEHGGRTSGVEKNLDFPDLLRLIDERSTAFRAVVAAAPGLDAQVPTCPGWTLFDLVKHLGGETASGPPSSARGPTTRPRPKPSPRARRWKCRGSARP